MWYNLPYNHNFKEKKVDRKNENKYIGIQLLGIAFLASAGIWVKLSSVGPISQGFYRMLLTLLMMIPFTYKSLKGLTRRQFLLAFAGGLCLGGDVLFWNLALMKTSVADCSLMVNLTVFIVSPISYFLFKEKIKKEFLIGAIIAFIGVVMVIFSAATGYNGESSVYGNIIAMLASVAYSGYVLFIYKVRDSLNNTAVILISTFGAMVFLFAGMVPFEGVALPPNAKEWMIIILYAVCTQILGQGLVSMCLGKLNATLVTVISLTGIGISAIYAYIIFGESLLPIELMGMIITIVGVFMAKKSSQES